MKKNNKGNKTIFIYKEEFKTDLKNSKEEQLIKIFNEKFFKTIMKIEKDNFGEL